MSTADPAHGRSTGMKTLILGAIGVVFGDIGTSPLYTMKEAFGHAYHLTPVDANVFGVLSMVFWSLILVVSLKYVVIIMNADNKGEGGIMALMALAQRHLPVASKLGYFVGVLGIFGAALFFGDSVITPAMSVLSAVEGLEVLAPSLHQYVVPITILILLGLFLIQSKGTDKVGKVFGPICAVWFAVLAVLGVMNIGQAPQVLNAINPYWAVHFFTSHDWHAVMVLGAVVLAITGGEALYADMGHFGKLPIRYAWWFFVLPALLLNYFGQGALVLKNPSVLANPFYLMAPKWALVPLIILACAATVIASQAVISGAFSVARAAMQLGYLPRLELKHTSADTMGQIFVPTVNRILLLVVIALVLTFKTSSNLASAYGVSVTGTMLIDTILLVIVARAKWGVSNLIVVPLAALFLFVDLGFLIANLSKFFDGAWFPLALGVVIFTVMRTWRRGRQLLVDELRKEKLDIGSFIKSINNSPPHRVSGTAIFMTAANDKVPLALLHNLKHNKVLHERNVMLAVETLNEPRVDQKDRVFRQDLGDGFHRINLRFGFMEDPDVPAALDAYESDIPLDPMDTTYFASRETVIASARRGMPIWRDKLFAFMLQNAQSATAFFRVPGNRLVELGTQVEI